MIDSCEHTACGVCAECALKETVRDPVSRETAKPFRVLFERMSPEARVDVEERVSASLEHMSLLPKCTCRDFETDSSCPRHGGGPGPDEERPTDEITMVSIPPPAGTQTEPAPPPDLMFVPLSDDEINELLSVTLHGPLPGQMMHRVFMTLSLVPELRRRARTKYEAGVAGDECVRCEKPLEAHDEQLMCPVR